MLQQTRVTAVLPYYERFLQDFPTVAALANAPEQKLLALWAGLGYYSRARNLQKAAQTVVETGAEFPRTAELIRELPGVGEYTAAAVASIAFGERQAAVDGNVLRVLSRLTAEPGDIGSQEIRKKLTGIANDLIDDGRPGDFNQAMMELGATLCTPTRPQCLVCPVMENCEARRMGRQQEFPIKLRKPAATTVEHRLLLIERRKAVLLWQRPPESQRMAGFWELPHAEQLPAAQQGRRLGEFRHTIVNTRFRFEVVEASVTKPGPEFSWKAIDNLREYPLSTTARKALSCSKTLRVVET